jgi:hypothetical protein
VAPFFCVNNLQDIDFKFALSSYFTGGPFDRRAPLFSHDSRVHRVPKTGAPAKSPSSFEGTDIASSTAYSESISGDFMTSKSLMVLHQAPEQLDRFISLGVTHNLVVLHEATDALSFLKRIPVDVILIRDGISGMDAMEFLMNLQDLHLSTYTIVLHREPFPVDFPEMRNVCFLREPVSSYDLNQFISNLGIQTQKIH